MISRRTFIKSCAVTALSAAGVTTAVLDAVAAAFTDASTLSLINDHTSERLDINFLKIRYPDEALSKTVNRFFRDFRQNVVHPIDPALMLFLASIKKRLQTTEPFTILSGYRSRETNDWLRSRGCGAAESSLHIRGQAADIRLEKSCTLKELHQVALDTNFGGVGLYPHNGFVHIDTGPFRRWTS